VLLRGAGTKGAGGVSWSRGVSAFPTQNRTFLRRKTGLARSNNVPTEEEGVLLAASGRTETTLCIRKRGTCSAPPQLKEGGLEVTHLKKGRMLSEKGERRPVLPAAKIRTMQERICAEQETRPRKRNLLGIEKKKGDPARARKLAEKLHCCPSTKWGGGGVRCMLQLEEYLDLVGKKKGDSATLDKEA